MNTPDRMKRIIALCTLTAWVLLYGVSFSENVESLQSTLENTDQAIKLALSLDVDRATDESSVIPKSIGLMNVTVVNDLQTSVSLLDAVGCQHHVPPSGPKLFKLLSTYRL